MWAELAVVGTFLALVALFYWIFVHHLGSDYRMPDWVDEYEPGGDE